MRRAPARPVRACILRKLCPVSHVTFEAPLRTSHFSLHSSHSKLHTSHSTLHTSHCTLRTPHFTSHCTPKTPHFTLHTPHFTLLTAFFTLHTSHCFLHTPHFTLLTPHFTLHSSPPTHTLILSRCPRHRGCRVLEQDLQFRARQTYWNILIWFKQQNLIGFKQPFMRMWHPKIGIVDHFWIPGS